MDFAPYATLVEKESSCCTEYYIAISSDGDLDFWKRVWHIAFGVVLRGASTTLRAGILYGVQMLRHATSTLYIQ